MCHRLEEIEEGAELVATGSPVRSVLRDPNHSTPTVKFQPLTDVSTQANLCVAEPTTYESEDELMGMGRRKQLRRSKRGTPLYSKEDIREQYCINDKQLHGLEDVHASGGLFGCLSTYHDTSSCSSRTPSLLSVCVRRKVPSDENLQELCRRPPHDYAPLPRWPRYFPHDEAEYFRRRPKSLCNDPNSYTWFPEDEENIRMERPRPIRPEEYEMCNSYPRRGPHYMSYSTEYLVGRHMPCPAHPLLPPPPPPPALVAAPHRTKHVSFARSHTLTSFDDAVVGIGSGIASCSQERLIDGKKCPDTAKEPAKVVVMEKVRRAPMKTQATQTEVCLGRKPLPPTCLSLSPRTIQRVRMVSQGAQTNGDKNNSRRLMKSFSEVGGQFGVAGVYPSVEPAESHEPLQRTQSEEPPRSPFLPTSPKEILIDFEPLERRGRKRILAKTLSDGEILESRKESPERGDGGTQSDCEQCYQQIALDEPLEKRSATSVFSEPENSSPLKQLLSADSQEEEFHENLIYGSGLFRKHSTSLDDTDVAPTPSSEVKVTPTTKIQSPFASNDSLNTRDHSDGIWNESQTTVLHADSDNNGAGTGVSCSDLSSSLTPSAAITSLTPSSRRKHLLMLQHQQRSSMDTEALDAEDLESEQPPLSPRVRIEPTQIVPVVAVTTPTHGKQLESSKHRSSPFHEVRLEQSLSPSHRTRRRSPGSRTPDPENQQQLITNDMLARSDSGKTNTDMSETSTTTEDYATATENNSGTDTSSRQLPRGDSGPTPGCTSIGAPSATGSSFESGSSLYSLARGDATEEVQQVPCSPPPIAEEKEKGSDGTEERRSRDADSISGESSSSGSYSVDGSSGEKQASDHSGHCSSPGEYESPVEDNGKTRAWTDEERSRVKQGFKLELSPHEERATPPPAATPPQHHRTVFPRKSPPSKESDNIETPRRIKNRSRSPVLPSGKRTPVQASKEIMTPGMVRSPAMHDGFRPEEWAAPQRHTPEEKTVISNGMVGGVSSEESSGECACGRPRRPRESPRRKAGGGRSPTTHIRTRRRSNSGEDSGRRRCSVVAKSPSPVAPFEDPSMLRTNNSRLCPHEIVRSPGGSPNRRGKTKGITSPDSARLKALSAESLRSVSPGSDSVFYSEHSSNTVTLTEQHSSSTCHHCGRHVESSPPSAGAGNNEGSNGTERSGGADIVQPPAGFEDSPRPLHKDRSTTPAPRLYKKVDKRFRSEERRHHARVHSEAVRAKSEERGKEEKREKIRPLTRSTDASMEKLRCSPSSLGSDDDDWNGIYTDSYNSSTWVYIGDTEELQVWQRPDSREDDDTPIGRRDSVESTHSEREFRRRYQAITHRMVHRKSSLEMYKRQASKSFESDKRVLVKRVSGEFGFRIHGSRPVVVSAIEPSTPAESSGLEVGDIVISVNKVNVLDASHSEVVKLAHGGSDTLELEVARTSDVFSTGRTIKPVLSGTLLRLSTSSTKTRGSWVSRHFVLKQDHCLYYYKTDTETQPVGALHLADYSVSRTPDSGCPHSFRLSKKGAASLHLATSSAEKTEQWIASLSQATKPMSEPWLDERCLKIPPTRIPQPDCAGTLCTLAHHRGKAWRRRFCLLKDACLYFYSDINAELASGMACLQGYRVQSSASGAKRFAFELVPPDPSLRHFYFYTDTEMDKKRWMAALEYSIDRWIKVG